MTILIPLNGKGGRFKTGHPKHLMRVNQKRMIQHVTDYLSAFGNITILCRQEYVRLLRRAVKNATIIPLIHNTAGPLETVLQLEGVIVRDHSLLIADCDAWFERPEELRDAIETFRAAHAHGGVTVRRSDNPGHSYALLDGNQVLETREKECFTPFSTTGPYWFASGEEFIWYGRQAIMHGVVSISPVYNEYIKAGKTVCAAHVESFVHVGTPEELDAYNRSQLHDII